MRTQTKKQEGKGEIEEEKFGKKGRKERRREGGREITQRLTSS